MNEPEFLKKAAEQPELTEDEQRQAGKPVAGSIGDDHKDFAKTVTELIDSGQIDPANPQSFVKQEVYQQLDEEWQDKTDAALVNITHQVRLIYDFYKDPNFTNDSPQLHTMIEQLWQMKQKVEEHHDVFVF